MQKLLLFLQRQFSEDATVSPETIFGRCLYQLDINDFLLGRNTVAGTSSVQKDKNNNSEILYNDDE